MNQDFEFFIARSFPELEAKMKNWKKAHPKVHISSASYSSLIRGTRDEYTCVVLYETIRESVATIAVPSNSQLVLES